MRAPIALCLTVALTARADAWSGPDKALHFGASATLASASFLLVHTTARQGILTSISFATTLTLLAGGAKEALDLAGLGDPSWKDFAFDVLGCLSGLVLGALLDWLFEARGQRLVTI